MPHHLCDLRSRDLAIIGIPPFSGFFVKDPIIDADFSEHGTAARSSGTLARDRRRHHRVRT